MEPDAARDSAPFGRLHWGVFVLALLCMTFEGYDTYAVSYLGPALSELWALTPDRLGVLFTMGIVGAAIGYAAIGPLSDRIGRRMPVVLGTAAFGAASLLSTTASGLPAFLAWRFITGLALGAVLPNIVAIAAETMPVRRRSLVIVVLYSGFAIGSALAGLVAGQLMPRYGWTAVLAVGGAVPIALAALMALRLPESPQFLALRDARSAHPVRDLFGDGRGASTLLIWLVLSMDVTTIGALVFWIPTVLRSAGLTLSAGISFSVVLLAGGVVGAFAIGWCMDRFGAYRILIPVHLCAAAFITTLALTVGTSPTLLAFLIGLTLNGGTSGTQGLLARLYPTGLRATGIGWASGVSRFVGIGQPLLTGLMLAAHWSPAATLLTCSLPALVSATALTRLSRDARAAPAGAAPTG
jgi:AAHS family 4-hydroxybenzoate transporter-like MFS transporter